MEVGAPVSLNGVVSSWIVHASASPCTIKLSRWHAKIQLLGITPWMPPHAYANRRWGKPSQNAEQLFAEAEGCVHEDLRANKLQKGRGFWVSTWNVDSLTEQVN